MKLMLEYLFVHVVHAYYRSREEAIGYNFSMAARTVVCVYTVRVCQCICYHREVRLSNLVATVVPYM